MSERIVECKPRPRNRVYVKLSGGRFFTIPESVSLPVRAGAVLSEPEIERLARIDQYLRGRDKALKLISIRSRTQHEIRCALDGLNIAPAIRDGILEELSETGLIDDIRFAREYVRTKVDVRRFGPHRLRHDLKKLGVGASIVDDVLEAEFTGERQEQLARDIVLRRLGTRRPDAKEARRLHGLLVRKGIDFEIAGRLIYELLTSAAPGESTEEGMT